MPEMDSMRDDLPALWFPMTAIIGRSMSVCTLPKTCHEHFKVVATKELHTRYHADD